MNDLVRIDERSGVPFYRQIVDQVLYGVTSKRLRPGDRLPTVRQLAVDLAVNPNTVAKAYRELEVLEVLETHQGSGTFVAKAPARASDVERRRKLDQLCEEFLANAGSYGFSLEEVASAIEERAAERSRGDRGERRGGK